MSAPRQIKVQRFDEGSGAWTDPRLLYSRKNVTCGEITGRASAGGVALMARCDTPYYEDQAPVESVALVTNNLRSWSERVLPGGAYLDPAISPDGGHAAWLAGGEGQFVLWSRDSGFTGLRSTTYRNDGYGETPVVTDDGTVSVMGPQSDGRNCVVGVHSRTASGELSSAIVDGVDPGCTEGALRNIDALRVEGGSDLDSRAGTFVISRADVDAPWELTTRAPSDAPGLVTYDGSPRRKISAQYSDVPDQDLLSIGSPDRRRIQVQSYDSEAETWGPRRVVYDHGFPGCTSNSGLRDEPLRVHLVELACYPTERADDTYPPYNDDYVPAPRHKQRVLLSPDGVRWRMVPVGRRPVGISADASRVAAFNRVKRAGGSFVVDRARGY